MSKGNQKLVVTMVPLSKIEAWGDQPRRKFDPAKLKNLMDSIKAQGLTSPITIEKKGVGYILIDGERRFRAMKALGWKECPALIREPQTDSERLIEAFQIQATHEDWDPAEKAMAVAQLADDLKLNIAQTARLLLIPEAMGRRYVSFSKLVDRMSFVKSEIPLEYATAIRSLTAAARKACHDNDIEWTKDDDHTLQDVLVKRIKSGDIVDKKSVGFLTDAIKMDHTIAKDLLGDKAKSTQQYYFRSNAKLSTHHRRLMINVKYACGEVRTAVPLGLQKLLTESDKNNIKKTIEALKVLL